MTSTESKIQKIFLNPKMKDHEAIFISSPEEVCWLLNHRALNVREYEPLINSMLLL